MSPRNNWTHDQRTTLWLLNTRFSLSDDENARLFNKIFADDLKKCGYEEEMEVSQIRDEYKQRTKAGKSKMWPTICNEDGWQAFEDSDENAVWVAGLLDNIWDAAEELEIGLAEADDIHKTMVAEEQIKKTKERAENGEVSTQARGLDYRLYNEIYVDAHPELVFRRFKLSMSEAGQRDRASHRKEREIYRRRRGVYKSAEE